MNSAFLKRCLLFLGTMGSLLSAQELPNPIVFVTQVPVPEDFGTIGSTFANHIPKPGTAIRGGDLWIRYQDGTLKNLTQSAGYGLPEGFQGSNAIAVRNPQVHWSGEKIIFSMVIGNPAEQYDLNSYYWQLYEITGLEVDDTPLITKVPNQPEDYNNVYPVYATDDQIIFSSDRPRRGERHHYPVQDEYDQAPSLTGLWKLNPSTGVLDLLNHVPSGAFSPVISDDGRVIFTRWDHLQRDQQADGGFGSFSFTSEAADAAMTSDLTEYFPEPRNTQNGVNRHRFNHFFPWQINEDGTEEEFLNHGGRHELSAYFTQSFQNDPGLDEHILSIAPVSNENPVLNFFMIHEDPTQPGRFIGIDAPEFLTHTSGQIIAVNSPSGANPDDWQIEYLTHPETRNADNNPPPEHSGLYRDVLPLSNGQLIAAHTFETRPDDNVGAGSSIASLYDYRLRLVTQNGDYFQATTAITSEITKSISFWSPDTSRSYAGPLWQLDPVELVARERPTPTTAHLPEIEEAVFEASNVNVQTLVDWMQANDLALVVSRNVTSRDRNDRQQPYNLQIAGSDTISDTGDGNLYQVRDLQFFQADHLRSWGGMDSPKSGRRVLPWPMHDDHGTNVPNPGGAQSSVRVAEDGSTAAFVPAERAMTWQLTDPDGQAVVRERYWVTFQPGEIRVCASCHGLNTLDQLGRPEPTNAPQALTELLEHWKIFTNQGDCTANLIAEAGADIQTSASEVLLDANMPIEGQGSWSILQGSGGLVREVNNPKSVFVGQPGQTYSLKWEVSATSCLPVSDQVQLEFYNCDLSDSFMNASPNWPSQSILSLVPLSGCQ